MNNDISDKRNIISICFYVIGFIFFVAGFIFSIYFIDVISKDYYYLIIMYYFSIIVFSLLFFAIAEVIQLLHDIRKKIYDRF